ncbi:hypothetical protein [Pseudanabaena minima]|uniref:hypothetical protein n=1 Tax=Pseudanabaena minima TaxID=890415 RepID=UPI003DA87F0B
MSLYKFPLLLKQRSPLYHPQTRSPNPQINQRSPITTHKPRSPNSPHQTAIAIY